jgi:hypothetical protein
VFGGWRGAGIPADALRRVGMLLGWGGGRVVVSSLTCRDVVGLSKNTSKMDVFGWWEGQGWWMEGGRDTRRRVTMRRHVVGVGWWKGGGVVVDVS